MLGKIEIIPLVQLKLASSASFPSMIAVAEVIEMAAQAEDTGCWYLVVEMTFYLGQRLSYQGDKCTIYFHGELRGKSGQWLGVEWDDESKGKHGGTIDGVRYFTCALNLKSPPFHKIKMKLSSAFALAKQGMAQKLQS